MPLTHKERFGAGFVAGVASAIAALDAAPAEVMRLGRLPKEHRDRFPGLMALMPNCPPGMDEGNEMHFGAGWLEAQTAFAASMLLTWDVLIGMSGPETYHSDGSLRDMQQDAAGKWVAVDTRH